MNPSDPTYRSKGLPDEIRRRLENMPPAEARALIDAWDASGARTSIEGVSGKERVRVYVMASICAVSDRSPVQSTPALRLIRSTRFVSVAATVVLLVIASFLLSPDVTSFSAPEGSMSGTSVELSDGSLVTLSPGSRLYLTDAFGDEHRNVNLHGNAFFDVEKSSTPFIIRTFDARTTVLGTSFGVQAWPTAVEAETSVHVLSGSVRVTETASNMSVTLAPGESGSTAVESAESVVVDRSVDVERATVWRNGGFSFVNEPVGDVLSEIDRRFDIRIEAPASIRLRRISYWKQSVDNADEIMSDIAATIGVRYRHTANGFSLYLSD